MRKTPIHAVTALCAIAAFVSCSSQATTVTPAPTAAAPSAAAPAQGGGRAALPVMPDSINALNERYVAQITAQIAGRENLPAEQVFKDIQLLKGQPASRLLMIMNAGYSRGLGVSCEHCHVPSDFASNAKEDKTTARGMIRMVNAINENNKTIPEFANNAVVVNCTVCHRGSPRPVRNMPAPGAPARAGAQPG